MTLRPSEIAAVCEEIATLVGQPVQKIVQPDATTVIVSLRGHWVLISADAALGRLGLVDKPAGTGDAAPAFCMLLRKELTGRRLEAVAAIFGERACELDFGERALRLFLYGRSAQLVLVDTVEERVLGTAGPARTRRLALPEPADVAGPAARFLSPSVSRQIADHYGRLAGETEAQHAQLALRKAIERLERRERALLGDLARADDAVNARRDGDLLLAHAADIPKGASEVTVPNDFSDGSPVVIALDPARNAKENAARLYHRYKRMQRGRAAIEARLAETRRALADLRENGVGPSTAKPATKPRGKTALVAKPPYHRFTSASGAVILVGRGADKNDELTFHVARGSDLWLHTRDVAGAHVVVPQQSGATDEQTLLDAATLAAWHSPARDEAQVDVGYTLRKNVRKPPRSTPGLVTTSAMKTIRVRMEKDRLDRLLATKS